MKLPAIGVAFAADDEPAWLDTRVPGVRWFPIHVPSREPDAKTAEGDAAAGDGVQDATVLIRMEPGHGYPPHRHVGAEEVVVLAGGYRDEEGEHRQGDYVRYPAGSVHAPVALGDSDTPAGPENPPCVLFAVAHDGIERVLAS